MSHLYNVMSRQRVMSHANRVMSQTYFSEVRTTSPMYAMLQSAAHDSLIRDTTHSYMTRLIYTWHIGMTLSWLIGVTLWCLAHDYVWRASPLFATWLPHVCDMTPSYVRHDSFLYATWLSHMCDMILSYMRHDSHLKASSAHRQRLSHMCILGSFAKET